MTKEIELTQGEKALVDDDDYERLSKFKWWTDRKKNTCYAVRTKMFQGKQVTITMHSLVLYVEDGLVTDHINRNGLDNRKSNLRPATRQQNSINRGPQSKNKSGYKGVSWNKRDKRWAAAMKINGKTTFLGNYKSIIDAARRFDDEAFKLHGEYAYLNFPRTV